MLGVFRVGLAECRKSMYMPVLTLIAEAAYVFRLFFRIIVYGLNLRLVFSLL